EDTPAGRPAEGPATKTFAPFAPLREARVDASCKLVLASTAPPEGPATKKTFAPFAPLREAHVDAACRSIVNFYVIVADQNGFTESAFFVFHFEIEHTAWTHRSADSTSHARGTNHILSTLCIPPHVDAHLAVGGTVAT